MFNINIKKQRGVSLYLAVIIMTILLTIAFGINIILISQIKMIREMHYSVIAFYAADTGIEQVLMDRNNPSDISTTTLPNGAIYVVGVTPAGGECDAENYCIESIGIFKGTRRAIEIKY